MVQKFKRYFMKLEELSRDELVRSAEKLVLTVKAVENHITAGFQELAVPHEGPVHPRVIAVLRYLQETRALNRMKPAEE